MMFLRYVNFVKLFITSCMIKRKLSRSRKGEYTLTLSGLTIDHVDLLYSIFSNISLNHFKGIDEIGYSSKGLTLPYECLETLIPMDYFVRGESTLLGCTKHKALRELLNAFPWAVDNIPLREHLYNLKTLELL